MGTIANVQYLRAIAALMVVFGHAQHDAVVWAGKTGAAFAPSHLLPWGAGVDLFFVISGFIMVFASRDLFASPGGAGIFATRRLIRIVPLYWLMSALYLCMQYVQSRGIGKPMPAVSDIAAAFAFFPVDTFDDRFIRPFFTLGWTLNYEMFFYLCFALALALPRALAVSVLGAAMALFVTFGAIFVPQNAALYFWSQAIILEFVLGMALALALLHGIRLPNLLRLGLTIGALALLWQDFLNTASRPDGWITPNDSARVLAWGLPAAMLVAAAVLKDGAPAPATGPLARLGVLLGDASYALYLSHPFVIVLIRKAMLATGLFQALGGWALVAACLIASMFVAVALHLWLERPLTRWLSRRYARPAPIASPKLA